MLKQEWTLTQVVVTLVDGVLVEGESAVLYVDQQGRPQVLQVSGKTRASIPWAQVRKIDHA